jgi:hypothetical protein
MRIDQRTKKAGRHSEEFNKPRFNTITAGHHLQDDNLLGGEESKVGELKQQQELQQGKFMFKIDHAELINMKKKSETMGVVVERNDPQYALGITHEHSLVAQRYMQRENIEVTFSTEHTKGKFSKSDQFTVSTFTHFTSCIGLLRQD